MRIETVTGNSGNYAQCFDCRNAPILPVLGDPKSDLITRVKYTAERHERLHTGHDVVVYIKTEAELPIVREMRERLLSGQK